MLPSSVSGVVPIEEMQGDDPEDMELLRADYEKARSFLLNHTWCFGLGEVYFGEGIGGIISIFLMELDPAPSGVDQWLWVIVGDIPSAYFVIDQCPTPIDGLKWYIAEGRRWVELAYTGETSSDVMPVEVPADAYHAEILERRLNILERTLISTKEEN
jgi:hypothetical protein